MSQRTKYQQRIYEQVCQKKSAGEVVDLSIIGKTDSNPILIRDCTQIRSSIQKDNEYLSLLQNKDYTKSTPVARGGFVKDGHYTTTKSVQPKITSYLSNSAGGQDLSQHFAEQKSKMFQRTPLTKPSSYDFFKEMTKLYKEQDKEKEKERQKERDYSNAQIV